MKQVLLALVMALTAACGEAQNMTAPESIKDVKSKHEDRLLTMPGVVSVGIGQNSSGKAVIIIGMESRDSANHLTLPNELDGYPVQIQVIGPIRTQ